MSIKKGSPWVVVGALLGALGVGMGAFGAHALEDMLTEHYRDVYETASKYMLVHAVLITALGLQNTPKIPTSIMNLFSIGVCIFSFTLWTLALTQIKWLGAITPIGGVLMIIGWVRLAWWGKNTGA